LTWGNAYHPEPPPPHRVEARILLRGFGSVDDWKQSWAFISTPTKKPSFQLPAPSSQLPAQDISSSLNGTAVAILLG